MDNLFETQISPILPSKLVRIVFIPVRYESRKNIEADHSLYVIRIIIPANMNTLYYLKNRNVCFVRRPEGNKMLNLKEVRQLAVLFCEKRFIIPSTPWWFGGFPFGLIILTNWTLLIQTCLNNFFDLFISVDLLLINY